MSDISSIKIIDEKLVSELYVESDRFDNQLRILLNSPAEYECFWPVFLFSNWNLVHGFLSLTLSRHLKCLVI